MSAKAKIDNFSAEELREIVKSSNTQKEILQKLGYTGRGRSEQTLKDRCAKYNISLEHLGRHHPTASSPTISDLCVNSTKTTTVIKRFILKESLIEYKCAKCGNEGEWQGEKLILQIDHINGISNDHRLDNLRFLCPNCHTQTNTYGSKNYGGRGVIG